MKCFCFKATPPPSGLARLLSDLFVEQENARCQLRMQHIKERVRLLSTRDCNPGISNPGFPAFFVNPASQDWRRLNPGISGSQKWVKIVLFCVMTNKNKFFNHLIKINILRAPVILCAVHCNLYFTVLSLHAVRIYFFVGAYTASYAWNNSFGDTKIKINL